MQLRNLDRRGSELLSVGVAGVVGAAFCLYALLFPALGLLFLIDENRVSDLATQVIYGAFVFVVTGAIAAGLVVCAAAIRMTALGHWPGRSFLLGFPGVAISAGTFALVALLAYLL